MNAVWLFMMVLGSLVALVTGNAESMMSAVLDGAYDAVQLVISLAGIFCLWVGIERLAHESGLIDLMARITRPILGPLFPHVKDEPAVMGAVSATVISNVFGLSSQTPMGLKAMSEIKAACANKEKRLQSMITLVVISAAGFCVFPSGIIALRAALGSESPAIVVGPTAVAGLVATVVGLSVHRLLSKGS